MCYAPAKTCMRHRMAQEIMTMRQMRRQCAYGAGRSPNLIPDVHGNTIYHFTLNFRISVLCVLDLHKLSFVLFLLITGCIFSSTRLSNKWELGVRKPYFFIRTPI